MKLEHRDSAIRIFYAPDGGGDVIATYRKWAEGEVKERRKRPEALQLPEAVWINPPVRGAQEGFGTEWWLSGPCRSTRSHRRHLGAPLPVTSSVDVTHNLIVLWKAPPCSGPERWTLFVSDNVTLP